MKKYTQQEYKKIFNDINNGATYTGIINGYGGFGKIQISGNNKYICWEHFGSSANKNTIDNLIFIINTIFKDCDQIVIAKYSEYHINYIPIDNNIIPVDYSLKHPNIYNL